MINIQLFNVAPAFPEKLRFLEELAGNLWWSWNYDAIELFRRINPHMWREVGHNPQIFMSRLPQKRLETLADDDAFLRHMHDVKKRFDADMTPQNEAADKSDSNSGCVAYFSLEYGIHESIRLYSGGLGVLAGDHLKAASDQKLPLVAIGLMYRQGYFQQYLNKDGWQQEHYPENQLYNLPLHPVTGSDGLPRHITLPLPEGKLQAAIWRLDVGRVPLFLLDANIPENPPEWRTITAQLYGGDRAVRLRQELLLGIGGFRALLAMGFDPQVFHMNEGHATFLSLARLSHMAEQGINIDAATEIVARTNCFTTHTPVPAGNEMFHTDLLKPHLDALREEIKIDPDTVISWGQPPGNDKHHEISMTILGLRWASFNNGVSRLHGKVARKMWGQLWPGRPEDELPITHITNGVHVPSWMSDDNAALCNRYLGKAWGHNTGSAEAMRGVDMIPDEELWRAHELGRSRLIRSCREMMEKQYRARNATRAELTQAKGVLEHDILTIGFARRFATYKRATLLLKDIKRFEELLLNEDRPVQFVFAGKAHPADDHGKDLIRQLVQFSRKNNIRRRIIFLENYDMNMARRMVQGVDVWLNVPRRPQEASGTSGMKAAINGGLNVSILDGWWDEGYNRDTGWAIGNGEEYDDPEYGDSVESQALYNLLENEVVPCFYDRTSGDLPQQWIHMMKASIKMGLTFFTSHRMVCEYNERFYGPALENLRRLTDNNAAIATKLVEQRKRLRENWHNIYPARPQADREATQFHVGDRFSVSTEVQLGQLKPEEVEVQVYFGPVDSYNEIISSYVLPMDQVEDKGEGRYLFQREIACEHTGRYGFTVRVVPAGNDWNAVTPGFMTWADGVQ